VAWWLTRSSKRGFWLLCRLLAPPLRFVTHTWWSHPRAGAGRYQVTAGVPTVLSVLSVLSVQQVLCGWPVGNGAASALYAGLQAQTRAAQDDSGTGTRRRRSACSCHPVVYGAWLVLTFKVVGPGVVHACTRHRYAV
jgi:hypothetical protein